MTAELLKEGKVQASASLVPGYEESLFVIDVPVLSDEGKLWGVIRAAVAFKPYVGEVGPPCEPPLTAH